MSLPLHDLGSIKVSEQAHSFLKARALKSKTEIATLVRGLIHDYVSSELDVFRIANDVHESKELGGILEDNK